jgi:uncharacterized protein YdiU (UPF0061 family)
MNPIAGQRYRALPAGMFFDADPSPVQAPTLIELNRGLLEEFAVDSAWYESELGIATLAGNVVNRANPPIALAYSGHQFGHWVPLLGDGRAHMLGQISVQEGRAVDVQLKGSGRTHYSRGGDGRATLGSVLREYLISEAMAGLRIPTTRSLAIIGTGENVDRERTLPGAILARTASSHLRVGSFQHASVNLGEAAVKALADHVIGHHFTELENGSAPYAELLGAVVERQAALIARWMLVGFIHGVMNTDNMSIVGETIDYGPCAFIDEFDPRKVFSSIDRNGRYAWNQQPAIAHWNVTRFAEALLPILDSTEAKAIAIAEEQLALFGPRFQDSFSRGMQAKLGIRGSSAETNAFADATLAMLADNSIDFTVFFDRLTRGAGASDGTADDALIELFADRVKAIEWIAQWRHLESGDTELRSEMRRANPVLIARNHRVEQAIAAAQDRGDFAPFRQLCRALADPFEPTPEDLEFATPPRPEQRVTQTFCGT